MFVHKDLKKSLDVKLIDFGFAQKFGPSNPMTLVLGSPLYMAPELINHEKYDEKVDIWALGCISYMLINGRNPFHSDTVQNIYQSVLNK